MGWKTEEEQHQLPYFHFSIHQEVASGPFCLLVNSPWLLVFALFFFHYILALNLYCWKGIHFSWSLDFIFLCLFSGLIISLHFWFRDLLRELNKKYEILLMVLFLVFFLFLASEALLFLSFFWASLHSLSSPSLGIWPAEGFYVPDPCELTFANTLLLSNAAVSLGGAFISLEISSSFLIFFSLFSFILAWTFISLQIKEFRIMGLSINDSAYSSVFFFIREIYYGWCLRYLHSSGASFVFLFLFLHLGRAISYGSYFYNPNTWFSGILLFFLLMATAFMGYVLPFGQMSFWGATVITNLLSPFPSLIECVSGGHYVYNPTLKRFFIFHFLFPFLPM